MCRLADMPATVKPSEVKLAQQVIGTFEGNVDFASYRDEYQVGLREIIDAKIEGREIVAQEIEAPPKVVNLMDALRQAPRYHQRVEKDARRPRRKQQKDFTNRTGPRDEEASSRVAIVLP